MTQKCHLCTITQLCQAISSQLRHLSTVGKKLLKSSVSPTCPHNMVNFGPLTAEICWRVWGHPSKFQRVSCLGSITAQHSSSGRQPDFAVLNRGLSANLECMPELCCMRLTENTGCVNDAKMPSVHHHTTLSGYIFATKALIDSRKKSC